MNLFDAGRWIFAIRVALSALLAIYVCFLCNLPQASSSMITVFIVSQPYAGMAVARSIYRALGTACGCVVAIVLVTALSQEPVLFAVAASLWLAFCVAVSTFMRDAPSAYAAMLSGYTVALVAFPNVDNPDHIFQAALDRGAEIAVGIVCATVLSQIFFPRTAGAALKSTTAAAIASARQWALDVMSGAAKDAIEGDRRLLIARVTKLDGLRIHASFDSADVRIANDQIKALHTRLISFIALVVSIQDRLTWLREQAPARAENLDATLAEVASALGPSGSDGKLALSVKLRDAARARLSESKDRPTLIQQTILLRLADLVEHGAYLDLQAPSAINLRGAALARRHDGSLALVSAAAAFVTLGLVLAFWIATGWVHGSSAAIMVAVMTSLFTQQDNPASLITSFMAMLAAGAVVAAIYSFAIFPQLEAIETLLIVLAPFFLAAGFAMSSPRSALQGLGCAIGASSLLNLTNVPTYDFAGFVDSAIATLAGIGFAAAMQKALRPVGVAWPISRLVKGMHTELAAMLAGRGLRAKTAFESRMFDLIDGLMTRLDPGDPDQLAIERGALAALRVGLNTIELRLIADELPASVRRQLLQSLEELGEHFGALSRGEQSIPPVERLEATLDAALACDLPHRARDAPIWISSLAASINQNAPMFSSQERPRAA